MGPCGKCRFWLTGHNDNSEPNQYSVVAECRKHAPVAGLSPSLEYPPRHVPVWPSVHKDHGCGDYECREYVMGWKNPMTCSHDWVLDPRNPPGRKCTHCHVVSFDWDKEDES